eukprot:scaffold87710_cov42-Phaeocystis_antarctica.AAC.2
MRTRWPSALSLGSSLRSRTNLPGEGLHEPLGILAGALGLVGLAVGLVEVEERAVLDLVGVKGRARARVRAKARVRVKASVRVGVRVRVRVRGCAVLDLLDEPRVVAAVAEHHRDVVEGRGDAARAGARAAQQQLAVALQHGAVALVRVRIRVRARVRVRARAKLGLGLGASVGSACGAPSSAGW